MGWGLGFENGRWVGYSVPSVCDFPDCTTLIDRGMAYRCEEHITYGYVGIALDDGQVVLREEDDEQERVEEGCNWFFCEAHLAQTELHDQITEGAPDSFVWLAHMLYDDSWQEWRDEHPDQTTALVATLSGASTPTEGALT